MQKWYLKIKFGHGQTASGGHPSKQKHWVTGLKFNHVMVTIRVKILWDCPGVYLITVHGLTCN